MEKIGWKNRYEAWRATGSGDVVVIHDNLGFTYRGFGGPKKAGSIFRCTVHRRNAKEDYRKDGETTYRILHEVDQSEVDVMADLAGLPEPAECWWYATICD
jgi:hypothetical protein